MAYSKERTGLTQSQSVDNLKAVLSSNYFSGYDCCNVNVSSDLVNTNLKGGFTTKIVRLKAADITDTVISLLDVAGSRGTLTSALVTLEPSDEMLKTMGFEKKLREYDFGLPITFRVREEGATQQDSYGFRVANPGLDERHFESQNFDLRDARARVSKWHREVTQNLRKILPYKVSNPKFSK